MDYFVGRLTKDRNGSRTVRHVGNFKTLEAAIKAAQLLIDDILMSTHEPCMTALDLFSIYKKNEEVPVIFSDADFTISVGLFNHFQYAKVKCNEICK
jgi:hypothetical protein